MATAPHSSLLLEGANQILAAFIQAHGDESCNKLCASIDLKSYGTITCMKIKCNLLFSSISVFLFFSSR